MAEALRIVSREVSIRRNSRNADLQTRQGHDNRGPAFLSPNRQQRHQNFRSRRFPPVIFRYLSPGLCRCLAASFTRISRSRACDCTRFRATGARVDKLARETGSRLDDCFRAAYSSACADSKGGATWNSTFQPAGLTSPILTRPSSFSSEKKNWVGCR